jgi:UDP-glucose 4-epimerase
VATPTHPGGGRTVAVTGAAGLLGRRVVALLLADPDVGRVVSLDLRAPRRVEGAHEFRAADLATTDLKPLLDDVDQVVHLAFAVGPEVDEDGTARANVDGTRRLLEAAGAVGVDHLVVVSSTTVYGAWPGNPVPLTEAAPVRPNPGFSYAAQKAEVERLALEWVAAHPGAGVAVLRPAVALGGEEESWLGRSLRPSANLRAGDDDPPLQFVHLDDLAAAVALASRARLDGAYNVACDGWLSGEAVRSLTSVPPRLPVPELVLSRGAAWAWRRRLGGLPPGIVPYTRHPWVVANDRIRGQGWAPAHSNEEVLVEARQGAPWSTWSPKRRQELLLGAALGVVVAGAAGAAAVLRRRRRQARAGGPARRRPRAARRRAAPRGGPRRRGRGDGG